MACRRTLESSPPLAATRKRRGVSHARSIGAICSGTNCNCARLMSMPRARRAGAAPARSLAIGAVADETLVARLQQFLRGHRVEVVEACEQSVLQGDRDRVPVAMSAAQRL